MTSYASATSAWTPAEKEAHPDPRLLTQPESDSTSSGIIETKTSIEYTPPLTPPIAEQDQDKASDAGKEDKESEIPGSKFDHVIPGVRVMETRQLPDDLEKKIAKPCKLPSLFPLCLSRNPHIPRCPNKLTLEIDCGMM